MSAQTEQDRILAHRRANLITRREAIRRVSALLGGVALVGGHGLLTGCRDERVRTDEAGVVEFTAEDVAFLDEIAETILPETSTPGAKAAEVGAFMALMVRDVYGLDDQRVFVDGMRQLDEECQRMHGHGFMHATPQERLALLQQLDREAKDHMDARDEARRTRDAAGRPQTADTTEDLAYLPDQRQQASPEAADVSAVPGITADAPAHYFRMMKELALLGYFTSEIGYNQAMRYAETPGRFDPCLPYAQGEPAWAPHA